MERMKVPFGWHVWGGFTLLASLGVHGFLLSLPMSFDLNAPEPEPEPEPIAAIPLTTAPAISPPPPELLVSDREMSPTSEVMSIAEVYEPAASPQPEVIQAVEVYEPEVSPPSEVDIESESLDRTPNVSRDRNPQLPGQLTPELNKLRQQKIQSMRELAAQSSESPFQNQNPENTPLNSVSEMFAQIDTDLDDFLAEELDSGERTSYTTEEEIITVLKNISFENGEFPEYVFPDNPLKTFFLDDSDNFKEGIILGKLRIISFLPDVEMTAEQIYENAIKPTINLEEYQIHDLHDIEKDINEEKIYLVEKKTTPKLSEEHNFYIQLIMTKLPFQDGKIAAIVFWNQQPDFFFEN